MTPPSTETADDPASLSLARLEEIQHSLVQSIERMSRRIRDTTRFVDEKRVQTLAGDSELIVQLLPQFERYGEHIESVIVGGPPASAVTVQLGERVWPLIIPATGILVLAPIGITLDYEDTRQLIAAVPGDYWLELTGYADVRNRA